MLEIRDGNPEDVFEWSPLKMHALLVNVQQEWRLLQTKVLSGGSARRELDLEYYVDGVRVTNSNNSWWKFDNKIEFVNPTALSTDKISILLLSGHDSFRVFALITLPVFYLNMHGRRRPMPGLVASGVGMTGLLLLLWYQGSIIRNSFRPSTAVPHAFDSNTNVWEVHRLLPMVVFGRNDLVAVFNFESASWVQIIAQFGSLILVALPMYLGFLSLLLRWLFVGFLQPYFPKHMAKLVRLVTTATPGSVKDALDEPVQHHDRNQLLHVNATQADVMNGKPPRPRADVHLGMPEPSYWLESDYHKRKRCARNHVRILLRGKVWYEAQILKVMAAKKKTPIVQRLKALCRPKAKQPVAKQPAAEQPAAEQAASIQPATSMDKALQLKKKVSFKRNVQIAASEASAAETDTFGSAARASSETPSPPPSPPQPVDKASAVEEAEAKYKVALQHRRAPLEGPDSLFYPLRLKMACALSLWICFMLTLIFYNLLDWAISSLTMAGQLERMILATKPHSDQLYTHLAYYPILVMSSLSLVGATITPDNPTYQTIIYGYAISGCALIYGCIFYQWKAIFRSFREHTFMLRQGDYFIDRAAFREEVANKYIGYQVSHMTISFTLLTILYLILTIILTPFILSGLGVIEEAPKGNLLITVGWWVLHKIIPKSTDSLVMVIPLVGSLGFQFFCNRKIFFVGNAKNQVRGNLRAMTLSVPTTSFAPHCCNSSSVTLRDPP